MVRRLLLVAGLLAAVVAAANYPVSTHTGVNYHWTEKKIPLYEKLVNFVSRDVQTRRLAQEITQGSLSDEERLLRLYDWASEHVRPTPPGFPIVDDHVFHIIVRGYGGVDQVTEVFVVLAGYAGLHGSVARLYHPDHKERFLIVALIGQSGGRKYVFDVFNRVVFRDAQGHLIDTQQLLLRHELVESATQGRHANGLPYHEYYFGLDHPWTFSRTEAQKLWPRMKQEIFRLFQRHEQHGGGVS